MARTKKPAFTPEQDQEILTRLRKGGAENRSIVMAVEYGVSIPTIYAARDRALEAQGYKSKKAHPKVSPITTPEGNGINHRHDTSAGGENASQGAA